MPPRPFYDIEPKTYLFGKPDRPEEKIRQWIIFELLSTYGVLIGNISTELQVQIGSKKLFADVVLLKNGLPYVVIECKKKNHTKPMEGVKQAQSYAYALKAEFAVYTDGSHWIATRRVVDSWKTVPDIERETVGRETSAVESILWLLDTIRPTLYWLHRPVPSKHAQRFFVHVQQLLYRLYAHRQHAKLDPELHKATEFLLRSLSHNPFAADDYNHSNIDAAYKAIESFFHRIGFVAPIPLDYPEVHSFDEKIDFMEGDLHSLSQNSRGMSQSEDLLLIKFAIALLQYFRDSRKAGIYLVVAEGFVKEYQEFITPLCRNFFGVELPERTDDLYELQVLSGNDWAKT